MRVSLLDQAKQATSISTLNMDYSKHEAALNEIDKGKRIEEHDSKSEQTQGKSEQTPIHSEAQQVSKGKEEQP